MTLRSSEMGSLIRSYMRPLTFYMRPSWSNWTLPTCSIVSIDQTCCCQCIISFPTCTLFASRHIFNRLSCILALTLFCRRRVHSRAIHLDLSCSVSPFILCSHRYSVTLHWSTWMTSLCHPIRVLSVLMSSVCWIMEERWVSS